MKFLVAAITIALGAAAFGVALRAAQVWRKASNVGVNSLTYAEAELAARDLYEKNAEAGRLNAKAAQLTAWAAILAAITTLWGTVAPLFTC